VTPIAITSDVLDIAAIAASVSGPGHGAVATFVGLVRHENAGRRVRFLEYEAYEPLALKALQRILDEARDQWPSARAVCHHRIGRLEIGEASVAIAVASPHRADAFAACRYVIERVKQIAPIWKHEHFDGGEVWVEGATADPLDEPSRMLALARARGTA
jgi:molybdopterin synthase catalytic subunit